MNEHDERIERSEGSVVQKITRKEYRRTESGEERGSQVQRWSR
jgi:hypothetical protein